MTTFETQAGSLAAPPAAGKGPAALRKLQSISIERGPGLKDTLSFTSQLAVMVKAGIDIRSAVEGIGEQIKNRKFRAIVDQIRGDLEAGRSFSDALTRHPKVFSPLYVNMVRASELAGNFAEMLERIAAYQSQQAETRSMVIGAMVYPIIIAVMAVVTTVFLLTFVLPTFTMVFRGNEHLLPMSTKILMGLSAFLRTHWYVPLGAIVMAVVAFRLWVRNPGGQAQWDRVKLVLPLFKKMLRALYITRGVHTMGELVSAGVPMLETLRITAEVSGNTVYRRMWLEVHASVQQGDKIVTMLNRGNLLPRNVVQMISAGEESGSLAEVLRDVSEYYARELRNTIKTVTSMLEPLMIVVMGFIVGFIAMSIILPIFKMSSMVE